MATVRDEIEKTIRASGGSTLTKIGREADLKAFFRVMRQDLNLQVKSFSTLKTSQVQRYIDHQKTLGRSDRTIQNQMAHIRAGLAAHGREHFSKTEQMSNKALGISGASRDGTHRALTQEQYQVALHQARLVSPGAAATMQLQRELGLRAREAVQSPASLKSWEKAIQAGQPVQVLHGTKGGRGRWTGALDQSRALQAVRAAQAVCKEQSGKLIDSASLQGAARAYGRVCESVGLKGEHASHSLRCMYAQDRFGQHLERLCDRKEALSATSLDLGHGDGRGVYVAQVYLKL